MLQGIRGTVLQKRIIFTILRENKMNKLRPIQVKIYGMIKNPNYKKEGHVTSYREKIRDVVETIECSFHMFGSEYEEYDEGPGNQTVAICEKNNGEVISVPIDHIKFLDK